MNYLCQYPSLQIEININKNNNLDYHSSFHSSAIVRHTAPVTCDARRDRQILIEGSSSEAAGSSLRVLAPGPGPAGPPALALVASETLAGHGGSHSRWRSARIRNYEFC
jgi:hypothetical protein